MPSRAYIMADDSAIVSPKLQVIENADATGDKALRNRKSPQWVCRGIDCSTPLSPLVDIIDSPFASRPSVVGYWSIP